MKTLKVFKRLAVLSAAAAVMLSGISGSYAYASDKTAEKAEIRLLPSLFKFGTWFNSECVIRNCGIGFADYFKIMNAFTNCRGEHCSPTVFCLRCNKTPV